MINRARLTPYPCLVSMQLLSIQLTRRFLLNFALHCNALHCIETDS